ncbi:putative capsid protein [Odonata-associated circular virus-19]|uniref:putative capsid protein n=1 Tax=Odonata-associated circular virus-19 TaxID=1592119 RepID=UPI000586068A|nr:putative capsid protein [Odonata-associated circular virus-19]AJD07499.1 putative capsid protein [Odonata-associated circular virus-19]AJD07500.1 putative capsid protein [Odonata-associated circular virus-19]
MAIIRRSFRRRRPSARKPTRRYTRRPRVAAKRTGAPRTMRNSNTSQLIAPRYITTLKYCERDSVVTSVSGASGADLYNLNSIFDPDRTGTGHQPLGHDQLQLLYNRYRVFGVSWRVTFYQPGAGVAGLFAVFPQNNALTQNGVSTSVLKELPHAFTKLSRADQPVVFTGRVSLPKLTGQTPAQFKAGLEYQATFGASPSELQTLLVAVNPVTTGAQTFNYEIELKYHVECFDPIPLAQS